MAVKEVKLYEYKFGFELEDIVKEIFETTGFNVVEGEKTPDGTVTLRFAEELPQTAVQILEAKVKQIAPQLRFKGKKVIFRPV
jgi:hypothetical protein